MRTRVLLIGIIAAAAVTACGESGSNLPPVPTTIVDASDVGASEDTTTTTTSETDSGEAVEETTTTTVFAREVAVPG